MENEKNKILSDEELKDVSGGIVCLTCHTIKTPKECNAIAVCKWSAENRCIVK